jgi:hypothetical protein
VGEFSSAVDEEGRDRLVRKGRELDFSSSSCAHRQAPRSSPFPSRSPPGPPAIAEILKPILPPPVFLSSDCALCGNEDSSNRICNFWISF